MIPRLRLLASAVALSWVTIGNGAVYTITPSADAFVREQVPDGNYGRGGLLTVSGPAATNAANVMNGSADAFLQFSTAATRAQLDASFGHDQWAIVAASLELVEVTNPGNPIFNAGAGQFQVQWMKEDSWQEGSGSPNSPGVTGITWNNRTAYVNATFDKSLGVFSNPLSGGVVTCSLALDRAFIADLMSGDQTSFHLTAATGTTGFNFRSRDFMSDPTVQPKLRLTAEPLTPLQLWRQLWFGEISNSGAAADGNDYDGDGLVNFLEWAFGLDPTSASLAPCSVTRNAEGLDFRYRRSNAAVQAGAIFAVEWSETLSGPWSTEGTLTAILSVDESFQQVRALLSTGDAARRFVRLKVTLP